MNSKMYWGTYVLRVRGAGNLADFDVPHPDGGIASEAKLEAGGVAVAGAEVNVHWYKRMVMLIWNQGSGLFAYCAVQSSVRKSSGYLLDS